MQDDEEYASIQELRHQMQNLMERQGLNEGDEQESTFQEQIARYQSHLSQLTHVREARHQTRDGCHNRNDFP